MVLALEPFEKAPSPAPPQRRRCGSKCIGLCSVLLIVEVVLGWLLWSAWMPLGLPAQLSVASHAADSVVRVWARRPWGPAQGSGFVWDREGHIVTNHHVIEESLDVTVQFAGGEVCPTRVVGSSLACDLAVLELVDCAHHPSTAEPLALSWLPPRFGDRVATVGHPDNGFRTPENGVVAGVGRQSAYTLSRWELRGGVQRFLRHCDVDGLVLSTAGGSPSSSSRVAGGPLLSPGGRVVGVSTWFFSGSGNHPRMSMAIRTSVLRRVVPVLLAGGRFQSPSVGLEEKLGPARFTFDEYAPERYTPWCRAILPQFQVAGLLGMRASGCRLWRRPGHCAREAGLRRMDELKWIGWRRVRTEADAVAAVQRQAPGAPLAISYRRPGDRPGRLRRTTLQVYAVQRGYPWYRVRRWLQRGMKAYLAARYVPKAAGSLGDSTGYLLGNLFGRRDLGRRIRRSMGNLGDDFRIFIRRPRTLTQFAKKTWRDLVW